jgi:hypothetical protein
VAFQPTLPAKTWAELQALAPGERAYAFVMAQSVTDANGATLTLGQRLMAAMDADHEALAGKSSVTEEEYWRLVYGDHVAERAAIGANVEAMRLALTDAEKATYEEKRQQGAADVQRVFPRAANGEGFVEKIMGWIKSVLNSVGIHIPGFNDADTTTPTTQTGATQETPQSQQQNGQDNGTPQQGDLGTLPSPVTPGARAAGQQTVAP